MSMLSVSVNVAEAIEKRRAVEKVARHFEETTAQNAVSSRKAVG